MNGIPDHIAAEQFRRPTSNIQKLKYLRSLSPQNNKQPRPSAVVGTPLFDSLPAFRNGRSSFQRLRPSYASEPKLEGSSTSQTTAPSSKDPTEQPVVTGSSPMASRGHVSSTSPHSLEEAISLTDVEPPTFSQKATHVFVHGGLETLSETADDGGGSEAQSRAETEYTVGQGMPPSRPQHRILSRSSSSWAASPALQSLYRLKERRTSGASPRHSIGDSSSVAPSIHSEMQINSARQPARFDGRATVSLDGRPARSTRRPFNATAAPSYRTWSAKIGPQVIGSMDDAAAGAEAPPNPRSLLRTYSKGSLGTTGSTVLQRREWTNTRRSKSRSSRSQAKPVARSSSLPSPRSSRHVPKRTMLSPYQRKQQLLQEELPPPPPSPSGWKDYAPVWESLPKRPPTVGESRSQALK